MAKRCKNCKEDCRGEVWKRWQRSSPIKRYKHRSRYGRIARYSTCTCGCNNPEPKE